MKNYLIITNINGIYSRLEELLNRTGNVINLAGVASQLSSLDFLVGEVHKSRQFLEFYEVSCVIHFLVGQQNLGAPLLNLLNAADELEEIELITVEIKNFFEISDNEIHVVKNFPIEPSLHEKNKKGFGIQLDGLLFSGLKNEGFLQENITTKPDNEKKYKISLVDDIADTILSPGGLDAEVNYEELSWKELKDQVGTISQLAPYFSDQSDNNCQSNRIETYFRQQNCCLRPIYEMNPSDVWRREEVANLRYKMGKDLCRKIPIDLKTRLDYIVPVPDTGRFYAKGISDELDILYLEAISGNRKLGRGLQIQDTDQRNMFIRQKLQLECGSVRGKIVGIVDEAIFTGTTLKIVSELLREAEAREIYFFIPTPFNSSVCNYNIQPRRTLLLDYVRRNDFKEYFDVDGVIMGDLLSLKNNLTRQALLCHECFSASQSN